MDKPEVRLSTANDVRVGAGRPRDRHVDGGHICGRLQTEAGVRPRQHDLIADLADAQRRYSQTLVRTAKAAARLKQLVPEE